MKHFIPCERCGESSHCACYHRACCKCGSKEHSTASHMGLTGDDRLAREAEDCKMHHSFKERGEEQ
jgi:hypothetical protein